MSRSCELLSHGADLVRICISFPPAYAYGYGSSLVTLGRAQSPVSRNPAAHSIASPPHKSTDSYATSPSAPPTHVHRTPRRSSGNGSMEPSSDSLFCWTCRPRAASAPV